MNGDRLALVQIGIYCVVAAAFAYERNWPKAAYFVSAASITASVLFMR